MLDYRLMFDYLVNSKNQLLRTSPPLLQPLQLRLKLSINFCQKTRRRRILKMSAYSCGPDNPPDPHSYRHLWRRGFGVRESMAWNIFICKFL